MCVFSSVIKYFVRAFILNYYSTRKHQFFHGLSFSCNDVKWKLRKQENFEKGSSYLCFSDLSHKAFGG